MEPPQKTVVVTGATGPQGTAVTRHLLRDGWQVRALTRDPNGPGAVALARAGARVVRARMEDVDSLTAAAEGAWGLFSVQPTVGSPGTAPDFTAEDEVRWGMNVAEAAHAAGVGHLVFTSVAGADRHPEEKVPANLVSKWRIERHIAALGLPATILRPVSFMENFTGGYALRDGTLSTGLAPDVPQQVMAVDDVGAVTALAFSRPQEWIGRAVALAGDELTPVRIAAAIGEALGIPLPYVRIPIDAIRALSEDFAYANEWLNTLGYRADLPATRRIHPAVMDFGTWLERTGASRIAAFLDSARDSAPGSAPDSARAAGQEA
ncbi:NmrA family transcriptional regulator [Kitasatospora xanthocidica]|uniref:NmrA/HSCARG family protein n=1 Tax=Kitasatospora xanthocidica TaxID=83382 RepID=UPI0016779C26|nr:NmrA/HSCARG family protein [Kitasatospora xanthocidica]GHF78050.1 NmrA family transcriptional regulator [Kitasatospora xanthocidica]